jgi:hypothetical protein
VFLGALGARLGQVLQGRDARQLRHAVLLGASITYPAQPRNIFPKDPRASTSVFLKLECIL